MALRRYDPFALELVGEAFPAARRIKDLRDATAIWYGLCVAPSSALARKRHDWRDAIYRSTPRHVDGRPSMHLALRSSSVSKELRSEHHAIG